MTFMMILLSVNQIISEPGLTLLGRLFMSVGKIRIGILHQVVWPDVTKTQPDFIISIGFLLYFFFFLTLGRIRIRVLHWFGCLGFTRTWSVSGFGKIWLLESMQYSNPQKKKAADSIKSIRVRIKFSHSFRCIIIKNVTFFLQKDLK